MISTHLLIPLSFQLRKSHGELSSNPGVCSVLQMNGRYVVPKVKVANHSRSKATHGKHDSSGVFKFEGNS